MFACSVYFFVVVAVFVLSFFILDSFGFGLFVVFRLVVCLFFCVVCYECGLGPGLGFSGLWRFVSELWVCIF